MTILLVDDEPTIRRMLKSFLQRRGFQVLEAAGGPEALDLARAHSIDILLTDVVLEGMDGPRLAAHLLEQIPALRLLFISGYPVDPRISAQFPNSLFLQKPFHPGDLADAIKKIAAATNPPA